MSKGFFLESMNLNMAILAELKGAFMSVLLFSLLGIEFPVPGSNISHGLKSLKCFCPHSLDHFEELTMIGTGSGTLQDLATEYPVPCLLALVIFCSMLCLCSFACCPCH